MEAQDNPQLMIYALAAMETLGLENYDAEFVIVQPRQDDPKRYGSASAKELAAFKAQVMQAMDAALKPGAPRVAGEHCKFCKIKASCPAQKQIADITFEQATELKTPDKLTPDQLRQALNYRSIVTDWFTALEDYAREQILSGVEIGGYKVVAGRSYRKWCADIPEDILEQELIRLGCKEPMRRAIKTISEVEKEIGKGKVDGLTYKPEGKPTLVTDTDKRRPLVVESTTFSSAVESSNSSVNDGWDF